MLEIKTDNSYLSVIPLLSFCCLLCFAYPIIDANEKLYFLLIFSLQRNVRIPRQKLESQLRRNLYATQKAFPRVKKYIMQKQRNTCTQIQNTLFLSFKVQSHPVLNHHKDKIQLTQSQML